MIVRCAPMTAANRADAHALLAMFLRDEAHYRASASIYGDGGVPALVRALELFLARPEIGFVNERAWRFYKRLGFQALDEERLALLI